MISRIDLLRLTDFRSYAAGELKPQGRSVFLFGPNGAGKTNLLEALSLLAPGRGLRGAAFGEIGRRAVGEATSRAWAVFAEVSGEPGQRRIGTGLETAGSSRRTVRIDGAPAAPAALTELARPLWLSPAQDRLFVEGAAERRRFFDRLVFAAEPAHGSEAASYERAARERARLLAEPAPDPDWLTALEARLAASGSKMARARVAALRGLAEEITGCTASAFPRAELRLTGDWEALAQSGAPEAEIAGRLGAALAASRTADAAAGRALVGPHRCDLEVRLDGRLARDGSTGEQKALMLSLVLAQARRLSREKTAPNPILLLDEVAAHLDPSRRAALFDEIESLALQAFLTGTEGALFEALEGRALGVRIEASRFEPQERNR